MQATGFCATPEAQAVIKGKLFDRLMQGFPGRSFLFWKIEPDTTKNFRFFTFSRE